MHEQSTATLAEPPARTLKDGPVGVTTQHLRRALLAAAFSLVGCSTQPPAAAPAPTVAAQWREASITAPVQPREDWWRSLNDAGIDALMEYALRQTPVPAIGLGVAAPPRLGLQVEVADGAVALRACVLAAQQLLEDVQSRVADIETDRGRLGAEVARRAELQSAIANVASGRVATTDAENQCTRKLHNLGALVGLRPDDVLVAMNLDGPLTQTAMPVPPQIAVAPPAILLASHPAVVAAARKVEATYRALAGASADRYPRLSLSGSDGSFSHVGVGQAAIQRRNSEYDEAVFKLNQVLRETVRDVESALAQIQSAGSREQFAGAGVLEAQALVRTTLAGYSVDQISFSELQQARGILLAARQSHLAAQRDRLQGWLALVRASGNAIQAFPGPHAAAPIAALHQRAASLFPGRAFQ